MNGEDTLHG